MNDRSFKTQGEVLDYLHGLGLKISRAKLSKDYRTGILRCEPDKAFLESNIKNYAESLKAPDFHPETMVDNAQARKLRRLKAMVLNFCTVMPDLDAIAAALAKWLEKEDNDPEITKQLAICQRRVARRIAKTQKLAMSCQKEEHNKSQQTPLSTQSCIPNSADVEFFTMAEYWRRRHNLTPDLISFPDIPGGYDKIDEFDPHARFCLTGVFAYGQRGDCEKLVRSLGGKVAKYPVQYEQSYVVVGTLAAPGWSLGTYGNKIELGIKLRDNGGSVKIITEDNWIELALAYKNNM